MGMALLIGPALSGTAQQTSSAVRLQQANRLLAQALPYAHGLENADACREALLQIADEAHAQRNARLESEAIRTLVTKEPAAQDPFLWVRLGQVEIQDGHSLEGVAALQQAVRLRSRTNESEDEAASAIQDRLKIAVAMTQFSNRLQWGTLNEVHNSLGRIKTPAVRLTLLQAEADALEAIRKQGGGIEGVGDGGYAGDIRAWLDREPSLREALWAERVQATLPETYRTGEIYAGKSLAFRAHDFLRGYPGWAIEEKAMASGARDVTLLGAYLLYQGDRDGALEAASVLDKYFANYVDQTAGTKRLFAQACRLGAITALDRVARLRGDEAFHRLMMQRNREVQTPSVTDYLHSLGSAGNGIWTDFANMNSLFTSRQKQTIARYNPPGTPSDPTQEAVWAYEERIELASQISGRPGVRLAEEAVKLTARLPLDRRLRSAVEILQLPAFGSGKEKRDSLQTSVLDQARGLAADAIRDPGLTKAIESEPGLAGVLITLDGLCIRLGMKAPGGEKAAVPSLRAMAAKAPRKEELVSLADLLRQANDRKGADLAETRAFDIAMHESSEDADENVRRMRFILGTYERRGLGRAADIWRKYALKNYLSALRQGKLHFPVYQYILDYPVDHPNEVAQIASEALSSSAHAAEAPALGLMLTAYARRCSLGKPADYAEFARLLEKLTEEQGRTDRLHELTAIVAAKRMFGMPFPENEWKDRFLAAVRQGQGMEETAGLVKLGRADQALAWLAEVNDDRMQALVRVWVAAALRA